VKNMLPFHSLARALLLSRAEIKEAIAWWVTFCLALVIALADIESTSAQVQTIYEPYFFSTFAGNPPGAVDGTGTAARFDGPFGLVVDSSGNKYICDSDNNTIRKMTSEGAVTVLAGAPGAEGSADGVGDAARFFSPKGIATDSPGNLYIADSNNNTIRKITIDSNGIATVTTLAGMAGSSGSMDGMGSAARFNFPTGVAVDAATGNLYVADDGNSTIRKITPTGLVTTLAGVAGDPGSVDGVGPAAQFRSPGGVAVDGEGNVYVADSGNHKIRKITIDGDGIGTVITLAGMAGMPGSADGTGEAARFFGPNGIAVDAAGASIYVADTQNDTIRKVSATGVVTTLAGGAGVIGSEDGTGGSARFDKPKGITLTNGGLVYVADTNNNTIRSVDLAGVVSTPAGAAGSGSEDGTGEAARFNAPAGIAMDGSGNLYVADNNNQIIRRITPAGVVTTYAGSRGTVGSADGTGSEARFNYPAGMAVDSEGALYIADSANDTIRKITPNPNGTDGDVITLAGLALVPGSDDGTGGPGGTARFNQPAGVAVDAAKNLYIADSMNDTIRKISPTGDVITLAGSPGVRGSIDGTGASARFNQPRGVAVDLSGIVYVGDTNSNNIRKITPEGVVTTLAGLGLLGSGSVDGTGIAARFFHPKGLAVDAAGNLYVADSTNHEIRKVTSAGVATTLAGSAGRTGGADGTGSVARFHFPSAITIDSIGNLYTADNVNNTIRAGVATPPVITSPLLAQAFVDQEFVYKFVAAGATPGSLNAESLPDGLVFDGSLAAITGKPTVSGQFQVRLTASNAIGETSQTLNLTVDPAPAITIVNNTGATGGIRGQLFTYQVRATGVTASATVTATGLPTGLTMDNSGFISGVVPDTLTVDESLDLITAAPAQDGSSLVTITVTDGNNTATAMLQLNFTSNPMIPVITSPTEVVVTPGQPVSYQITTDSQALPATSYLVGPLPEGLTFNSATGVISGTYPTSTSNRIYPDVSSGIVTNSPIYAGNSNGVGNSSLIFRPAAGGVANISTRMSVGTGDNVLIGGFILLGDADSEKLILRAIGPSLPLSRTLPDPVLSLVDGNNLLQTDDNWRDIQETQVSGTGIPPANDLESAIVAVLEPAPPPGHGYTAVLSGKNGSTGQGLVEIYDLGTGTVDLSGDAYLANISTRGYVDTGDNIMIAGLILQTPARVIVRAIGPELAALGVANVLADPTLELHQNVNGTDTIIATNDNWRATQEAEIIATTIPPANDLESAIVATLQPYAPARTTYSAVLKGTNNTTGVALVEVYYLGPP
jgi:DNA-binding beta-propeller fold protein YncE